VFDLRKALAAARPASPVARARGAFSFDADADAAIGSNNWAVDAAHSASGHAMVANDMHLALDLPNVWYRAELAFPDADAPNTTQRLAGVTLPGVPSLVVGSNGHVAWGFTNSAGDWSDLVRLEPDPHDVMKYLTPDGPKPFVTIEESIAVKDEAARPLTVRETMWGPVVWKDADGREYAQRWVAHDADVLSSDLSRVERTTTIDEMLEAFAGLGIPNQNVVMADETGRIAWTIGGAIPRRVGFDGLTPTSWADGSRGWDGYLTATEFPRIVDPEGGRIWTANAPVVDGARLATIGDGGYADGIRARLIRDRLTGLAQATPHDMLEVQLEDRALFLERWRTLVLDALAGDRTPARAEFRRLVDTTWTGHASPDSVSYRLVRAFRTTLVRQVFDALTAPVRAKDPSFDYTRSFRSEGPLWDLVTAQPAHLLDPKFSSWKEQFVAAVDAVIADLAGGGIALSSRTWGGVNYVQIAHPLAAVVPQALKGLLSMPAAPLPGDVYTPRASAPRTGPSERMIVSPGHEEDGILHMPGGQSGHPLSPHFGDEQRAWLEGTALPLLAGVPVSTLTLTPAAR
jgi:penicillin amidase